MAIDGDPRTKGLGGKARAFEQASYKNLTIDLGIDFHRPADEDAPFKDQVIVSAADIHLTMTNPRISDRKFHSDHLALRRASQDLLRTRNSLMSAIRTTASDIDPEQGRHAEQRPNGFAKLKAPPWATAAALASDEAVSAPDEGVAGGSRPGILRSRSFDRHKPTPALAHGCDLQVTRKHAAASPAWSCIVHTILTRTDSVNSGQNQSNRWPSFQRWRYYRWSSGFCSCRSTP
jgi:hypothetical protein